ncbi:unnamed protein product [Enterobius vermicularis]|uniref:Ty3-gypsy retrotransposon protein n=1 Tax=Enterobius vermicularis TaxID=51028 RepID=A0A0N4UZ15_ENTVE|nr:unnamed protein product [Enterobius vermicularis]
MSPQDKIDQILYDMENTMHDAAQRVEKFINQDKPSQRPHLTIRYSSSKLPLKETVTGYETLTIQPVKPINPEPQLISDQPVEFQAEDVHTQNRRTRSARTPNQSKTR